MMIRAALVLAALAVVAAPARASAPQAVAAIAPVASDDIVRDVIADVAVAQLRRLDPAWIPEQRDCAGFIRFAYRTAFAKLGKSAPLFVDDHGRASNFADAETLVTKSFVPLGRGADARRSLRSGDVVAFRSDRGAGEVVWHLMLVVVEAPGVGARVIYHPGDGGDALRTGALADLIDDAPFEWRPIPSNPSFLGFFRFREFGGSA